MAEVFTSDASGQGKGGPAPRRTVIGYGFWIFILSDFVMFSAFFAAFAVLRSATDGGPTGQQLFDLRHAFEETVALLASSVACGMLAIATAHGRRSAFLTWAAATAMLGAVFLLLEVGEFVDLVARGAGPSRSAFLSSFFALVGAHGLHVAAGLVWLAVMTAQVLTRGFEDHVATRTFCFTLFWHALDVIWVALLTNVYLIGGRG